MAHAPPPGGSNWVKIIKMTVKDEFFFCFLETFLGEGQGRQKKKENEIQSIEQKDFFFFSFTHT